MDATKWIFVFFIHLFIPFFTFFFIKKKGNKHKKDIISEIINDETNQYAEFKSIQKLLISTGESKSSHIVESVNILSIILKFPFLRILNKEKTENKAMMVKNIPTPSSNIFRRIYFEFLNNFIFLLKNLIHLYFFEIYLSKFYGSSKTF
jgi:hypothetical protein